MNVTALWIIVALVCIGVVGYQMWKHWDDDDSNSGGGNSGGGGGAPRNKL